MPFSHVPWAFLAMMLSLPTMGRLVPFGTGYSGPDFVSPSPFASSADMADPIVAAWTNRTTTAKASVKNTAATTHSRIHREPRLRESSGTVARTVIKSLELLEARSTTTRRVASGIGCGELMGRPTCIAARAADRVPPEIDEWMSLSNVDILPRLEMSPSRRTPATSGLGSGVVRQGPQDPPA